MPDLTRAGLSPAACLSEIFLHDHARTDGSAPGRAHTGQPFPPRRLPGARAGLQHHDVRGHRAVDRHLLSGPRPRDAAGHAAASWCDALGIPRRAADAAAWQAGRFPHRIDLRHGRGRGDRDGAVPCEFLDHVPGRAGARLCRGEPAPVSLRGRGTGARAVARQGDFLGHGGRRRRRGDRPVAGAADA